MISTSKLAPYAHYTLSDAVIPELPGYYRGKVRENYDLRNGTRILIATFFFSSRRRHTRCGRDWSSDVCSSDLGRW